MNIDFLKLIFISLMIVTCDREHPAQLTTVSGEIINPVGNVVSLRTSAGDVTDTLDVENQFSVILDIKKPEEVRFRHGNEITYLYISPGDDLKMSLDADLFDETLTFHGKGAEMNRYKAAMVLLADTVGNQQQLFSLPEDQFLYANDSLVALRLSFLDDYDIQDHQFIAYTTGNLKWEALLYRLYYEDYHQRLTDSVHFSVSTHYNDYLESINLNDSTQINYPGYITFVKGVIDKEISQEETAESYYLSYYQSVDKLITLRPLKEEVLFELIKTRFSYFKSEERTTIIDGWKFTNPRSDRLTQVNAMIKNWEYLEPGNPAPPFKFISIDGDSVSLEDFRGDLVYVDVWATWCGPCLAEHPAMEKLQKQFEGEKITFISVSIDPEPEQWKRMVTRKNLGGVHLYAPGEYQSHMNRAYLIRGIPRFILIDPQGNIIDANASRPSGDISDKLLELLKKRTT